MKYCSQCGSGMQDGDKFCMNCGNEYAKNGGAKSTVPPVPADQQQHSVQNNADTSQPVVTSQIAPQTTPSPRSRRRSGLRTKLILGAIMAILLAAGGLWGWSIYGPKAQVEKKLDLAVKYISDNNYEQAILAFNDAINIDPKEVQGYQGLAKTYTLQGNYDEARNTYEKGIAAVTPQNKQILQLGLAGMYIDQNKLTDAEQAYSEIMNSSTTCLEAYWGLAMVYQQQEDSKKAEAILRQAVEKNPNEYRGYNTLALFLSQNNKQDEALNNIVQSLAIEINQQEAYLVLDSMYQNKWDELRNKTTSLSNQNVAAMLEFYSYYAAGDYPNAINIYQSKLSSQTTNQKAKILAAICLVKNGDKNSAEALIKQLNISKLNPWLLGDLGRYYLATGDQDKAREYAIKALQANPTNLDAIALLQAINANDPDASFYTVRALLYNWRPIQMSNQLLLSWTAMSQLNNKINTLEINDSNEAGNTSGNIVNGGLVAAKGDWIYYCQNGSLNKARADGSDKTTLVNDLAYDINVVGDWVFYINDDRNSHIGPRSVYRIKTDGTNKEKIRNLPANDMIVVDDWIYYAGNYGYLNKIRTNGQDGVQLNRTTSWYMNIVGKWVYYSDMDNKTIYRLNVDDRSADRLINSTGLFIVVGEKIYFSNDSDLGKLYTVNTDGSNLTKISDDEIGVFNINGDWIYYSNREDNNKLYKISTNGSMKTILCDDQVLSISIAADWIYYENISEHFKLYRIRTDGTGRQVVDPDE